MTLLLVVIVLVVVGVVAFGLSERRQRTEREVESGIVSFRREMRALAPPDRRPRRPSAPEAPPEEPDRGA